MKYVGEKPMRTTIIALALFIFGIPEVCAKYNVSYSNVSAKTYIYPEEKTMAAVVRTKELDLIDFKADNKITELDKGGMFSRPIISPDKGYVAYLKDNVLYVTTVKGKKTKVKENVSMLSYVWFDKNHLLYSPDSGGIYIYDTEKKESQPYVDNEFNYQNITIGADEKIYAEKYLYYSKAGNEYINDYGVVIFTPDTKKEQIIMPSIPKDQQNNIGMYPVIAGISEGLRYLYIFEHPHSGSLAADGLRLASYDTKLNKYIKCPNEQIITLRYKDNISSNPINGEYIALINGAFRQMNESKTLGILNVLTGTFERLSPKSQAAMTPYYSEDGKNILYAASKELEGVGNAGSWFENKHPIYEINIETKQITQLTKSYEGFDFAPSFISLKDIVFLKIEITGNISMWKLESGNEIKIIDGLIFYKDQFKVGDYYGHFNYVDFIDII